jgi:hypothetical protein
MEYCGLEWSGVGQGKVKSSCECGNEIPGSIKCWGSIEWLQNWSPLEYSSAPQICYLAGSLVRSLVS